MMTFELKCEKFEANRVMTRNCLGGVQHVFRFQNNYGASVVKHEGSYGNLQDLWELAVIRYGATGKYDLVYDTGITEDVEGYLTDEQVCELLEQIKNLDEPKNNKT